jgi:6,7-dimethyl-8-ribityllumazine synthase
MNVKALSVSLLVTFLVDIGCTDAFAPVAISSSALSIATNPVIATQKPSQQQQQLSLNMAAESEVSFDSNLDGTDVRVGIIRTRWNEPDVKNLVAGCRKALKELNVKDENIFETTVPGSFELPLAARFLALSGTVDAIVTAGVLIKGEVRLACDLSL